MRGGARRDRPAAAVVAVVAAVGALAAPASTAAGTYRVLACDAAPRGQAGAWEPRAASRMFAAASCPTGGDAQRGLVVRNRVGVGTVRRGGAATMTFEAPAGARLQGIHFDWRGRRVEDHWSLGLAAAGRGLLAGCPGEPAGASRRCNLGGRGLYRRIGGARSIRFEARCRGRGGCDTRPVGSSGERTRARVSVERATVVVSDGSAPNLTASGALLAGGWQRGPQPVPVRAYDNVGVRTLALAVDGTRHRLHEPRCDFSRRVPCPRRAGSTIRLNTRKLRDGRHSVAVTARDTAGNERRTERTVRVDNHAPFRVRDVQVVGGGKVRSRNSFDVRWTPPPRQAAPIAAARYRLCRAGSNRRCRLGVREGAVHGIDDLAVPGRGDWRLRVWLRDRAGNASAATASRPVRLRFDPRAETRVRATIATDGGPASRRATVDFDEPPLIEGSVSAGTSGRLSGVALAVLSRTRGSDRLRRVDTIRTDHAGRFRYRVRRGPSRTFRVEYQGGQHHRPSAARVQLAVRAKSSLEASRRRVPNGGRVRFSGRLLGRPVPSEGKLVQLQAFYRDRWRTFALLRTDDRGHWRYAYRFEATTGRVTYPFRVRIPSERSYPYEVGRSRVVRVTVAGP